MKKRVFVLLGAALVAAASIPRTFAQEEKAVIRKRVIERETMGIPDLTDAQKDQIKNLENAADKEALGIRTDTGVLEAELQKLLVSDGASQKDIDRKIDEISALRTRMAKLHAKLQRDIRSLLSPEQRIVFDKQKLDRPMMRHRMIERGQVERRMRRGIAPEPGFEIEKEEIIEE